MFIANNVTKVFCKVKNENKILVLKILNWFWSPEMTLFQRKESFFVDVNERFS